MAEQTQEQVIKGLQDTIKDFKVRTFDLQETLQSERDSFSQFVSVVGQLIGIEGEEAKSLQAYVDKLVIITGHGQAEVNAEETGE
jgi:2-keto-3-deoxy-galactonokinase